MNPDPQLEVEPDDCSDEPKLTAEEWEFIGVMAPPAGDDA